jgi:hypothetical protein
MTFRGHVHNGQVVLDEPVSLPEGAMVQVSPLDQPAGMAAPQVYRPQVCSPLPNEIEQSRSIERCFQQLAREWKAATALTSSGTELLLHPAYQQIIGMGKEVVGLIVAELRREPDHWFWALKAITGEDPVAIGDRGKIDRMTEAWLNWAEERGL